MKRLLLTFLTAALTLAASAQTTYNEQLVVTVNGQSVDPISASIIVTDNGNGTCDFTLKNFKLNDSNPVGTILLQGVLMEDKGAYTAISTTQTIQITEGDDPDAPYWLGPMLGEVPIVLDGKFTATQLYANIDITMTVGAEQQIINVVVGDVNTAIGQVALTPSASAGQPVYTLGGVRVARSLSGSLPKGVYIIGGKKVIR